MVALVDTHVNTSLVYRINDTIRYVSSIHWSDTRYVSWYVSYHLFNTKYCGDLTVIKKSHKRTAAYSIKWVKEDTRQKLRKEKITLKMIAYNCHLVMSK